MSPGSVHEGENHHLAKKPIQLDYHRRIRQWFGHYLKGEKPEKWIVEGMTYLEREEEVTRQKGAAPEKTER